MAKRQRVAEQSTGVPIRKRARKSTGKASTLSRTDRAIPPPLLSHCYRKVETLGDYLLSSLPTNSRVRRRRLISSCDAVAEHSVLLNHTLVGHHLPFCPSLHSARSRELAHFTQSQRTSQLQSATEPACSLEEVIDFVVWTLFKDRTNACKKPNHLLCHGYESSVTAHTVATEHYNPVLPGILQRRTNDSISVLRSSAWRQIMALLGVDGGIIFTSLFLDCGIFTRNTTEFSSYHQLSGVPIHDLELMNNIGQVQDPARSFNSHASNSQHHFVRKPGEIQFVRNRMLYSKPSLNRDGSIAFGFKHIHVLNRISDLHEYSQDVIIMTYVFPRQFKLHNVFTSLVNKRETTQTFKDYTFREDELCRSTRSKRPVPSRLRGSIFTLIRKIRHQHSRCAYDQMLAYYCPVHSHNKRNESDEIANHFPFNTQQLSTKLLSSLHDSASLNNPSTPSTQHDDTSFLPYAIPAGCVSSFCRAVLKRLLPRSVFGLGDDGDYNWQRLLSHVDKFVHMRRFETLNLHELTQGLKLRTITWLAPHGIALRPKLAATDKQKRDELLHELLYFTFDSLLIPLIAANFYVTETGIHRNKLLYFRHDVWKRLCEPSLASIKMTGLAPINSRQAHILTSAKLGYSTVRVLPKEFGTRLIANLRRRHIVQNNGKRFLVQSINSQLTPVFNIFNYERIRDQGVFRSENLSTQNLQAQLASFKAKLSGKSQQSLYFVKVDIQSAFDSIPQAKLLHLVKNLFKHQKYYTTRYAESKLIWSNGSLQKSINFTKGARPADISLESNQANGPSSRGKANSIHSDIDQYHIISQDQARKLLDEHIMSNIIRIGNKYHKKLEGIPQGSILSTLLCTFFYNDFEKKRLDFLSPDSSLLLRIIDDFLLITTKQSEAVQFTRAMEAGDENYGILVHPEKSLVNFDMALRGVQLPKLTQSSSFPFCGLFIDTASLHVSKDRMRKDNIIANTLTVDSHGHVGEKFRRRLVSSLRIQLHGIVLDNSLNDRDQIVQTLLECFQETAMKLHQYNISLAKSKRPTFIQVQSLVEMLINLVCKNLRRRQDVNQRMFTRASISSLAACAFLRVLETKSVLYCRLIEWLRELKVKTLHSLNMQVNKLDRLVDAAFRSLAHYMY